MNNILNKEVPKLTKDNYLNSFFDYLKDHEELFDFYLDYLKINKKCLSGDEWLSHLLQKYNVLLSLAEEIRLIPPEDRVNNLNNGLFDFHDYIGREDGLTYHIVLDMKKHLIEIRKQIKKKTKL